MYDDDVAREGSALQCFHFTNDTLGEQESPQVDRHAGLKLHVSELILLTVYSATSDSGPSEERT